MVAKVMRLAPGGLHIESKQDDFLRAQVVGQINCLKSRVGALIYVAGII